MKKEELKKILEEHQRWLNNEGGVIANLCEANLRGADLRKADICEANLRGADLRGADLREADLREANLYGADLRGADLRGADICEANLRGADLCECKNLPFIPSFLPDGEFIAWKKVEDKIVKIKVLEDSKRSRATTEKCRCDKALVLAIENLDGTDSGLISIINTNYTNTEYKVGEIVYADSWDDDRWRECSHGIHFFVDRQSAVDY